MIIFFLYDWLLDSCSDYTNFYSYCRTRIPKETQTNEVNAETKTQPVTVKTKMS